MATFSRLSGAPKRNSLTPLARLRAHRVAIACLLAGLVTACGRRTDEPQQVARIPQAATITAWAAGVSYSIGDLASHAGITYRCRQAHTSQVGWEPPSTPALWERPGSSGIQPWGIQVAYSAGDGVTYDGLVYRCLTGHNSQSDWTPPATPTLWKLTGDVQIPPGVSGSLAFVFTAKNLPTDVLDGLGLVQRDPFGDATYTELLDTSQRNVGEVFHRVQGPGGRDLRALPAGQ